MRPGFAEIGARVSMMSCFHAHYEDNRNDGPLKGNEHHRGASKDQLDRYEGYQYGHRLIEPGRPGESERLQNGGNPENDAGGQRDPQEAINL